MPIKLQPEERFQVFVIRRLREILPADVDVWAIEQNSNLDTREEKQRIAAIRRWQRLLNKGCIPGVVDLQYRLERVARSLSVPGQRRWWVSIVSRAKRG